MRATPQKTFHQAVDDIGRKHEPPRHERDLGVEEGADELATDESENPEYWEQQWSNCT